MQAQPGTIRRPEYSKQSLKALPAIVGDVSAQLPLGLLGDVGHEGVLRLGGAHHMVPQLLVLVDVCFRAQFPPLGLWGRVAIVEEALRVHCLAWLGL